MLSKLDSNQYNSASDFLNDIDLIAENAIAYNSDLQYETNKIICHRARALQDFSYALVKAEMDTDFEDNCKEIVERRKKLTKKLKDSPELFDRSPSGSGGGQASSSVKKKRPPPRRRVSSWAKGLDTSKSRRNKKRAEEDEDNNENGAVSGDETAPGNGEQPSLTNGVNGGPHGEEEEEDVEMATEEVNGVGGEDTGSKRNSGGGRRNYNGDLAPSASFNKSGVRVDQAKLGYIHQDLVKITDGFPVEKLERIFCVLMEIVQGYALSVDRTTLPENLKIKLNEIKTARYSRD